MVSDVILSSARGTDVAQRIKSLRPALPIVFVSGFGMDDLVSRGLLELDHLSAARFSFLQKPFALRRCSPLLRGSWLSHNCPSPWADAFTVACGCGEESGR
jgi:FixJ family two-component response regulator